MKPFSLNHSPFTVGYPSTVIHAASRLMVKGKHTANGQRLTANEGAGGAV